MKNGKPQKDILGGQEEVGLDNYLCWFSIMCSMALFPNSLYDHSVYMHGEGGGVIVYMRVSKSQY